MIGTRAVLPLLAAAALAACEKAPEESGAGGTKEVPTAPAPVKPAKKPDAAPKRELPAVPALTPEKAKATLQAQLRALAADDESRQALLYLADLGERSAVSAVREQLLAESQGTFEDASAAALGAEALLAFGEPDGAAVLLRALKELRATEFPEDEYFVYALARVQGAERAEAVRELLRIAQDEEDPDIAAVAVQRLAEMAAPEAADAFVAIATDADQVEEARGSALAGLLRLGDARAKEIGDRLVKEMTDPDGDARPDSFISGLAVEGATEASAIVRRVVDDVFAQDDPALFEVTAAVAALSRIHAKGGGADLVPWLRELAAREDGFHADEVARVLFALGDDASAALVAQDLEAMLLNWTTPVVSMEDAVGLLELVARRKAGGEPPLRRLVDVAAQLDPTRGSGQPPAPTIVALNLAGSYAFLKSTAK